METHQTAALINDLILMNTDRYYGYKTAIPETKDEDLKRIFTEFSNQGKWFSQELITIDMSAQPTQINGETPNSRKSYRLWLDFRSAVAGSDRQAIIKSCELAENEAKKTYEAAIEHGSHLSRQAITIIRKQNEVLKKSFDAIKSISQ